jgi:murein tripeptide amidase MpaA
VDLLHIEGPRDYVAQLLSVPGLHVVVSSATPVDGDRWSVSAFGDPASVPAGLETRTIKSERDLHADFAAAAAFAEGVEGGYLNSTQVEDRLGSLATEHPDLCKHEQLPNRTHEGKTPSFLRLASGAPGQRKVALVVGGLHAREWAPPDALLSLATGLLKAYATGTEFAHPAWSDGGVPYGAWSIPAAKVKHILDRLEVLLFPLANPDGRDFTLTTLPPGTPDAEVVLHRMWRKNRRPLPPGLHDPSCAGVDLNRNFDLAWDFKRYFEPDALPRVACSTEPCDQNQTYVGPAPASEPEVLNVQWLVDKNPVEWYLDVHSFSRRVLFPWGMDDVQSGDETENWRNTDWDRRRNGAPGGYGEYLPRKLAEEHRHAARAIADAILRQAGNDAVARRRSVYSPTPELSLYPTTGNSNDYCVSRALLDSSRPDAHSFCLECGNVQAPNDPDDNDGGFQPDYQKKFPKVEREVHAAVLALLEQAL